jgi:hypothetical protein
MTTSMQAFPHPLRSAAALFSGTRGTAYRTVLFQQGIDLDDRQLSGCAYDALQPLERAIGLGLKA